jgi:hypothetical protein
MMQSLKELSETLAMYEEKLGDNRLVIDDILVRLNRIIRIIVEDPQIHRNGDSLSEALDAVFHISIELFRAIDSGERGLDDKMVIELSKIRTKYLGQK